ncbi:hypothetical protein Y032_1131g3661 [Ancylostoma ceylanicum]|uniref:Uncharacterized protein n=1 Tax=Ancylostoma ceylanicum TaxID=53326 RepID=A0A016W5Q2_9BILA|nr:hypothetical protein Y032_1131g3661 [Ancylostoma ceylanicum]
MNGTSRHSCVPDSLAALHTFVILMIIYLHESSISAFFFVVITGILRYLYDYGFECRLWSGILQWEYQLTCRILIISLCVYM